MSKLTGHIRIYRSELDVIARNTHGSPDLETGGELTGLWSHGGNPTVMLVGLPAPNSKRGSTWFEQDPEAHMELESYLWQEFGIQTIGLWHSHHQLGMHRLSSGDITRTQGYSVRHDRARYCEILAFLTEAVGNQREPLEVGLRPHVYKDASTGKALPSWIDVLPGVSPVRRALEEAKPAGLSHILEKRSWLRGHDTPRIYFVNAENLDPRAPDELVRPTTGGAADSQQPRDSALSDAAAGTPVHGQPTHTAASTLSLHSASAPAVPESPPASASAPGDVADSASSDTGIPNLPSGSGDEPLTRSPRDVPTDHVNPVEAGLRELESAMAEVLPDVAASRMRLVQRDGVVHMRVLGRSNRNLQLDLQIYSKDGRRAQAVMEASGPRGHIEFPLLRGRHVNGPELARLLRDGLVSIGYGEERER